MPVQINEVIVRAVVNPSPGSSGSASQPDCPPAGNSGMEADLQETILEIIKEKQER
jgi:Family of unknown function (DUF5908)